MKVTNGTKTFDEVSYQRALDLAGWKGYVTNLPATVMSGAEVISKYHELWHVEQSFRMSKTDLQARPIFHHLRDSIEAHLTIVFTALAVQRWLYQATGWSLKRIITTLKPLQATTVTIAGHVFHAADPITEDATHLHNTIHDHLDPSG